jgi:hypothetical protein
MPQVFHCKPTEASLQSKAQLPPTSTAHPFEGRCPIPCKQVAGITPQSPHSLAGRGAGDTSTYGWLYVCSVVCMQPRERLPSHGSAAHLTWLWAVSPKGVHPDTPNSIISESPWLTQLYMVSAHLHSLSGRKWDCESAPPPPISSSRVPKVTRRLEQTETLPEAHMFPRGRYGSLQCLT